MKNNHILVTGGTGYIGSHTVIALLNLDLKITILDNLSNSKRIVLDKIEKISGKQADLIVGDIRDKDLISETFSKNSFQSVIHFAGLKSVGESQTNPIDYYENNVVGSLNLINGMLENEVHKLIFSSSATVYGDPGYPKCSENTPLNPSNVYGQTKYFTEEIIRAVEKSNKDFRYAILRYFNPIGAHVSGLIGEDPNGIPNNLLPYISQVAVGKLEKLQVWGDDYPTPDGTGKRDYVHVEDLAAGHIAAMKRLNDDGNSLTVNLGTGKSYSVLEMIDSFEQVSGKDIPYEISSRRDGDISESFADVSLASELISWRAEHDLKRMCEDSWRWQSLNPNGYV